MPLHATAPPIDLASNLVHARAAGRRVSGVLAEWLSLMRGPGRMTPAEYFYYRLGDPTLTRDEERSFVGKRVRVAMHSACYISPRPSSDLSKR